MWDKIYIYTFKTESISEILHEKGEVDLHVMPIYFIMFVISANETKVTAKLIVSDSFQLHLSMHKLFNPYYPNSELFIENCCERPFLCKVKGM